MHWRLKQLPWKRILASQVSIFLLCWASPSESLVLNRGISLSQEKDALLSPENTSRVDG